MNQDPVCNSSVRVPLSKVFVDHTNPGKKDNKTPPKAKDQIIVNVVEEIDRLNKNKVTGNRNQRQGGQSRMSPKTCPTRGRVERGTPYPYEKTGGERKRLWT